MEPTLSTRTPIATPRKLRTKANGHGLPTDLADPPIPRDRRAVPANGNPAPRKAAERDLELGDLRDALRALKAGDFSVRILPGERRVTKEVATAFNDVAAMLDGTSVEFVRVSKVVGRDGEMMERAQLKGAQGGWSSQMESFNALIGDLVRPSTEVARVIIAVAAGDLSQKMALEIEGKPVRGEFLRISTSVNTMVDQLRSFASDVTRVAKEVGSEGKLGGQAEVKMSGTWKELTENVNLLASNLTAQVRNIALVTTAVANGDLSQKITVDARGDVLELKSTINTMVDQLSSLASEVMRVAKEVGTEGKLGGKAQLRMSGTWKDLTDGVNVLADNLTSQVRNIALVTTAVANGDLSQKIAVDARGELLELKTTVNKMVDQLSSFAGEVTRVAKEVGTDGKLGGQAEVKMSGTWKDLTDNVNRLAWNLTSQVRNIALVTTAVANGDLSQKIDVEAKGELLELKSTVNKMVDQLSSFASEVTRVAKEVGVEGKLGGQANVPVAAGTWRDLTDNVNQLANNLTGQVRAIMEVSIAVTQGDLTRSISVEAQGEVLALRGNLNQMIAKMRDTTLRNEEQGWLKTNLAKFSGMMQGQKTIEAVSRLIMSELTPLVSAHHGAFFIAGGESGAHELRLRASYAYQERKGVNNCFRLGEGLVGQSALEKKAILLTNVPSDYVQISSGLGQATPLNILVIPILFEDDVSAVIELASFQPFSEIHRLFLEQLSGSIGVVLNTIGATVKTVEALKQSQSLAEELRTQSKELQQQQSELRKSNQELGAQAKELKISEEQLKEQREELQKVNEQLEEKATLLAGQKLSVENKNQEVELARLALEEKAEQLVLASKYKSEFLANMSHELRTPLNSLLILSQLLADNPEGNLEAKQVEFATTIHAAGADLLSLINDILDLAKIESGTMSLDLDALELGALPAYVERNFGQIARTKGLAFDVALGAGLPHSISTDPRRLQQVLKNLLANAFKFTERGKISLSVAPANSGWSTDHATLGRAPTVIAFSVSDTGVGIAADKQQVIFQAFQQADGTTSRKYGGTGLGLSISREIVRLLGGEIRVDSAPGEGSTFTLYVPASYAAEPAPSGRRPVAAPTVRAERPERAQRPAPAAGLDATAADAPLPNFLGDDRADISPGDRVLLVIEDDATFASVLVELVRTMGFKCLAAMTGETGLALAHEYRPDAITLDLGLPGADGWIVLDRLKHSARTRRIPVYVISVDDAGRRRGAQLGALGFLTKPVTREGLIRALSDVRGLCDPETSHLLLVEDNEMQRRAIVELIGNGDVDVTVTGSGQAALEALGGRRFDCLVLDLGLPDMTGFELLDRIEADPRLDPLPIIVYTGRELTAEEAAELARRTDAIIIKDVHSMDHLLEQTALFLHRNEAKLSVPKQQMLKKLRESDPVLAGKTVLVIDDDVRNIFAITSVLERHKMTVLFAENGRQGLVVLEQNPGVQIVLMDVMMPEMDGYEATRAIRALEKHASLPIVALTAKAMKDDRERCIAAGASDYLTKPVEAEQLLSVLRVWLYR
jgi:CheY-like chemotaxis protein/HAMP domain-containing protein